jgi:copper(I)-binding protein
MEDVARVFPARLRRPALAALVLAVALAACSSTGGRITVADAWVRAVPAAGQPSAAYFVIRNDGDADALMSVSSPAAGMAGLHQTTTTGGMTGMQEIPKIDVPAHASVSLAEGGYHVMLMDLAAPLAAGATVELDLQFQHAGRIVVKAAVR